MKNYNGMNIPSENFGIKIMSVTLTTPSDDTALVWRSSVSALIFRRCEMGRVGFFSNWYAPWNRKCSTYNGSRISN